MPNYERLKEKFAFANTARSRASEILKYLAGMERRQDRKVWLDRHSHLSPEELLQAARDVSRKKPQ